MSNNKDKVMKSLIEENLKLRNQIIKLERELEIMQRNHVELLHDVVKCQLAIREILDILKNDSMFRNENERGSYSKR